MKNIKNTKSVTEKKTETKEIEELKSSIEELALTIDKVEDEKLEIVNQLKRALADYQNLEANTQKRLTLLYMQSRKGLAEKLIPIVDDLTMAVRSKEEIKFDQQSESWANGVVEILSNLEKSLEEIGLKKYLPEKGSKFEPNIHEALSVIEGEVPGVIYDVIQPGYILDDTVIRPSRVVVTKSK
ncbi:MAG: nucleotide exchange factor GrpE [Candidatus Dojkabacteria bacterium]|jgi:molecular chaperone GrpE|nr:nucleotide exchange factor GrpE [Candidatus Dojkabacteria bacterium]